jgi:type II secretory pathway pseudopilin PulG
MAHRRGKNQHRNKRRKAKKAQAKQLEEVLSNIKKQQEQQQGQGQDCTYHTESDAIADFEKCEAQNPPEITHLDVSSASGWSSYIPRIFRFVGLWQ